MSENVNLWLSLIWRILDMQLVHHSHVIYWKIGKSTMCCDTLWELWLNVVKRSYLFFTSFLHFLHDSIFGRKREGKLWEISFDEENIFINCSKQKESDRKSSLHQQCQQPEQVALFRWSARRIVCSIKSLNDIS